jgi:hypothetical protein
MEAAEELQRSGSATKLCVSHETDSEVHRSRYHGVSYVVNFHIRGDLTVAIKEAVAGRVFVSSI